MGIKEKMEELKHRGEHARDIRLLLNETEKEQAVIEKAIVKIVKRTFKHARSVVIGSNESGFTIAFDIVYTFEVSAEEIHEFEKKVGAVFAGVSPGFGSHLRLRFRYEEEE